MQFKYLKFLTGLCFLLAFFTSAQAEVAEKAKETVEARSTAKKFAAVARVNYEFVTPAQPTQSGGKIEVLEIFWYGCPHCYDFEPVLEEWLETKPDDVVFRRMPAIFRKNWMSHAKAFYAAEKLGLQKQIHSPLFEAMHSEGKSFPTEKSLVKFISSLDGVDAKAFKKAFNSFSVESKAKQAMRMSRNYGIKGVPSVVVNGKYYTSGSIAGNYDDLLLVVNALIEKERKKARK